MPELLVVIGILLVVSAIAVENITHARTMAKSARVVADFYTYRTAIESYHIDNNQIPRMRHVSFYNDPNIDYLYGQGVKGLIAPCLSTPIAYMANTLVVDPFMEGQNLAPVDTRLYTYHDLKTYRLKNPKSKFWPKAEEFYGTWRLGSVGPNQSFGGVAIANNAQLPYDPTNGLVSPGNIWRSQKLTETKMPPIPDLLGEH